MSTPKNATPCKLRHYHPKYANEIADVFHHAVHAISSEIYSPAQKEAWAETPPNYPFWKDRLEVKQPTLAIIHGSVAGFIELEPDGHIDCCYVHPKHQKQGVAKHLYQSLEAKAESLNLKQLYVEASIIALPFFEKQGFKVLRENLVLRKQETLVNYTMEKILANKS